MSKVVRRGEGGALLLAPTHAHQAWCSKQEWSSDRRSKAGQGQLGTDGQNEATPSRQAQPRVWAGIWLWPGRSDVGGWSRTGERAKVGGSQNRDEP